MKKNLLYAFFGLFLLAGCGGDDSKPVDNQTDTDVDGTVIDSNCTPVTGFIVIQEGANLKFAISTPQTALYYEVSLQRAGQGDLPGNGIGFVLNSTTAVKPLNELSPEFPAGDYVVYVRSVCGDTSRSKWIGPKLVTTISYCETPVIASFEAYAGLRWDYPYSDVQPSNFQVQYGPQGFALGNGVMATVNNSNSFNNAQLLANTSYDFYVRAYCPNNIGYGSWAGPFTYFSEENLNMCTAPSNLDYSVEYVNSTYSHVDISWKGNGETNFEVTVVNRNQPVNSGNITLIEGFYQSTYTITQSYNNNSHLDFYVRAVCSNGNKTVWVKKQIDL